MGGVIVLFQLTEDLRLADHHGVETGGDAKQMTHRFGAAVLISMLRQRHAITMSPLLGEKATDVVVRCGTIRSRGDHFDPIASGQDHAFVDGRIVV